MTWYLTIRALCVVAFVAAVGSILGAMCLADGGSHKRSAARRWAAYGFGFAILGSVLLGFGWGGEHP